MSAGPRFPSSGLVDSHIPFHQPANLPLGIAARHHTLEKVGVLLLGLGVLLGAETDYRQQVLDLTEHALLDHFADLLVTRPGRVLALVARARSKRKLHDFITEILWIRDTRRLFRLRQFGIE